MASTAGFGVAPLVLAPQRALPLVLLSLVAVGIGCTLYMSMSNALVQLATPGHLQGRVMGLYNREPHPCQCMALCHHPCSRGGGWEGGVP